MQGGKMFSGNKLLWGQANHDPCLRRGINQELGKEDINFAGEDWQRLLEDGGILI